MDGIDFEAFPSIPRLRRDCIITEKIDGTNAQVYITEEGELLAGSRNRWITPDNDNFGFARWAYQNKEELLTLGPGRHFGEWWGSGVQRGYGLTKGEKRFSLFNVKRWEGVVLPPSVDVVPILFEGPYSEDAVDICLENLRQRGSVAAPGFMNPEGVVVFHVASRSLFKVTIENDGVPKSKIAA